MSRHVLPQAPSPTMTSFRRISAMVVGVRGMAGEAETDQGAAGEAEGPGEMAERGWMKYV
jgi:hypothetical protein